MGEMNWFFLLVFALACAPVLGCLWWIVNSRIRDRRRARIAERMSTTYTNLPVQKVPGREEDRGKKRGSRDAERVDVPEPPPEPPEPAEPQPVRCDHPREVAHHDGPCDCWEDTQVFEVRNGMPAVPVVPRNGHRHPAPQPAADRSPAGPPPRRPAEQAPPPRTAEWDPPERQPQRPVHRNGVERRPAEPQHTAAQRPPAPRPVAERPPAQRPQRPPAQRRERHPAERQRPAQRTAVRPPAAQPQSPPQANGWSPPTGSGEFPRNGRHRLPE